MAGARVLSLAEAHDHFPTPDDVPEGVRERFEQLEAQLLADRPKPRPEVAVLRAKYQQIFSANGVPAADPADLKLFVNVTTRRQPRHHARLQSGLDLSPLGADSHTIRTRPSVE